MLLVQNLCFSRLNKKIYEDINLSLSIGKTILLSGKNGSGKTTFIKTIINILKPDSGNIYWKGKEINKNLYDFFNNVTYISDKPTSIKYLTIKENIKIWKKFFLSNIDDEQIENILSTLKLYEIANLKARNLSLGEIKKLEMLRLVIENKKVWILDEPLSNLDSGSLDIIKQTFDDHCNNGGSIIFTSHQKTIININEEIIIKDV